MAAASQRVGRYTRNSLTFDVIDTGPVDGIPVVLLHGFPQRGSAWSEVASRLNDAGLRTLAPDQRGYSANARPRSRFAYRVKELVADVIALLDEVGSERVHVAAHDWGAMVGWASAARHPERIASLTAVSMGHPRAFLRAMLSSDQARRSYYMALFQIPVFPERALSKPGSRAEHTLRMTGMPDKSVSQFRDEVVGTGALPGGLNWYRSLRS